MDSFEALIQDFDDQISELSKLDKEKGFIPIM
jgi:hypothetical protein